MNVSLDVSFMAFFLSGLLAFLMNIYWYHPKFLGGRWLAARGAERGRRAGDKSPWEERTKSPLPFMACFFLWTLSACFYSFLAGFLEVNTPMEFFVLSCVLCIAFSMPPLLMNALNTGYPFEATAIDAMCQLGGFYIFALVHIGFLQTGLM